MKRTNVSFKLKAILKTNIKTLVKTEEQRLRWIKAAEFTINKYNKILNNKEYPNYCDYCDTANKFRTTTSCASCINHMSDNNGDGCISHLYPTDYENIYIKIAHFKQKNNIDFEPAIQWAINKHLYIIEQLNKLELKYD